MADLSETASKVTISVWHLELTKKRSFGKKKVCTYAKSVDWANI